MLNKTELFPAASAAFEKALMEKVDWVSTKCWDSHLEMSIREFNPILTAGMELGVIKRSCRMFVDDEITELVDDLKPLRALKMANEAKAHIIRALVAHDVPATVFASKGEKITQEA